jgi:quinol monooxygenase YgiN
VRGTSALFIYTFSQAKDTHMAILMIGDSPKLKAEDYHNILAQMAPTLRAAPGFILHTAHPVEEGGFRIVEVWRSKEESDRFFAQHIAPNLPEGVRPKRRTLALSSLLTLTE